MREQHEEPDRPADEGRQEPDGGQVGDPNTEAKGAYRYENPAAAGGTVLRILRVTPIPPSPVAPEHKQPGAISFWDRMVRAETKREKERIAAAEGQQGS